MLYTLPTELNIKIASYLEPKDLASFSLVSKQCRSSALEHMLFHVHDDDTVQSAVDAGARKMKLTLTRADSLPTDPTILNKVVELRGPVHMFRNVVEL